MTQASASAQSQPAVSASANQSQSVTEGISDSAGGSSTQSGSQSISPTSVALNTTSVVDQLTEILHSANGPPAHGSSSSTNSTASSTSPYIDPDLLAGPKQSLIDGLTTLGNWANALDTYGKMASTLPLIGSNLGQILDLGGLLIARLRNPLVAYLNSDPTPTTDEFIAAIDALDFSGGGLTVETTGVQGGRIPGQGEFKFDLVFKATRISSLPINLGPTTDAFDLGVRGNPTVDVSASVVFNLSFGLKDLVESAPGSDQWNLSKTGAESFYVQVGSLTASVNASVAGGLNMGARVGFLDATVTNGDLNLLGNFSVTTVDPGVSPGSAGKITATELATPITNWVNVTLSGSASVRLPVTTSLFSGSQDLTLNWADVSDANTLTSNVGSLGKFSSFENLTPQTFINGVNALAGWADLLNNVNMLGRPLPMVSEAVRDTLDLKNFLVNRLLTQTSGFDSVQSLVTRLKSVSGFNAAGISTALNGNELTVTVPISANLTRTIPFILGHPDLPLNLNVPGFNLSLTVTGTLVLGIDISTQEFYLRDDAAGPELTVAGSLSVNNFSGSGGVSFLSVQVTNGVAQLSVSTGLEFRDPSNDHKLTTTDFNGGVGTLNSIVTSTFSGNGSLSLQLSSPFANLAPQTLTATWGDLNDQSTYAINLGSLSAFTGFNNIRANLFGFGLSQLAQILTNLSNNSLGGLNPLQTKLPLLNTNLADLINFDAFLKDAITRFTEVKYGADGQEQIAYSTSSELLALLKTIPGVGASNASASVTAEDIRYTLHLDKQISASKPIVLGVDSLLDLSITGTATATLDVDVDVTFGVNKSDGKFFVVTSSGPVFAAAGTVTVNVTGATRLGFLAVSLNNATASMVANLSVRLVDPASDSPGSPGKITATEMGSSPLASLFTVGLSGPTAGSAPTATISIGLTGTLGSWTKTGTLVIQWSDLRTPAAVTVNTAGIQELYNFNALNASDILQGLLSLPDLVAGLTDLTKFGANLPFIGSSLSGLVSLSTQMKGYLDALAPVGANGQRSPTYTTAQLLETRLEQILGGGPTSVSVTITGTEIQFAFSVRQTLVNRDISYNINEGVVGLGFQSQGTVRVNGFVEAKIRFGIAYGANVPVNQRFFIIPGADSSASLSFKLDAGVTAGGSLGLLTVSVANGTAKIGNSANIANDAVLSLALVDPNSVANTVGKITLGEILANPLSVLGTPNVQGRVEVVLPIRAAGIAVPVGKNPRIELTWGSLSNLSSLSVNQFDLESLLGAASNFNLSSALAGVQAIIQMIGQWANVSVMDVKIPLLDVRLKDIFNFVQQASQFFNTLSGVNVATAQAFDAAINSAFTSLGLPAGSALVASTDAAQHNPTDLANPRLRYLFRFHHDFLATDLDFKWGNDLFSLALKLKPTLSIDAQIEFGFSKDRGFYIVDRDTATGVIRPGDRVAGGEIQLSASITASNFVAGGQFGPVIYGVRDGNASVSYGVSINLTDPGSNGGGVGIITSSELTGNILAVLQAHLGGNASLILPMGLYLGNGGPGIKANFSLYWDASKPADFHFGSPTGSSDPADGFSGIQFELGEFLRKLIGPFLQKIDQFNPLPRDLVRTLNTKLPIINKSPIELLGSFTGNPEIALLFQIVQVVQDLSSIVNGGKDLDLSSFAALGVSAPSNAGTGSTNGGAAVSGGDGFLSSLDQYNIKIFGGKPSQILSNLPAAIIKILLKQDVDLIGWDPPAFRVDYEFNSPPIRLFSIGIPFLAEAAVEAQIYGKLGFFADLEIGFSSRGIFFDPDGAGPKKPDILNGFFIGDNIVNGVDGFETGFYGEVGLRLLGTVRILGIDAVQIYGQGGLRGTIGLDLSDVAYLNNDPTKKDHVIQMRDTPKGDNRVYLDEIEWITANYGFSCALSLGGSLEAVLGVGARALCGFWGCIIDLYDETTIPIINWDVPCAPNITDIASITGNVLSMNPDDTLGDKEITLSIRSDVNNNPTGLRFQRHTLPGDVPYMISSLDADTDIYGNSISDGTRARFTLDKKTYQFIGIAGIWLPVNAGPDTFHIDEKNEFEDFQFNNPSGPNYISPGVDTLVLEGGRTNDVFNLDPELTRVLNIKTIAIHGGPGNDRIQFGNIDPATSHLLNTTVEGGLGDDRIQGTFAADSLYGDEGNDILIGEGGNDILYGGDGNDTISGGDGNDYIAGEAGADTLYGQGGNNTIFGGSEEDTIVGGDDRDFVFGESGIDQISGSKGDDELHGGNDPDKIAGNEGNDLIFGDAGNDDLDGGSGDDQISGGTEDDVISGKEGSDVLSGGSGKDIISGDDGNDQIAGNEGDDIIHGGSGDDVIDAGSDNDTVYGDDGNDLVLGQSGIDTLYGGFGHDEIYGGLGADLIEGDSGNDLIYGEAGNDTINGGDGNDRIAGGGKALNTDSFGADVLNGGAGADIIMGDDGIYGSVILVGGSGNDIISGGADDDEIYGQGGDDIINADGGNDVVFGNDGNDTITGGDGNDVIHGDNGNDTISGNAGYDIIHGDAGNDLINGNDDTDDLYGDVGVDTIYAGAAADRVWGGDGNDVIFGESGIDVIRGESGDDTIDGGGEADVIYGGDGVDTIAGGAGSDRIYGGQGNDVIYGYQLSLVGDDNTRDDIFGEEGNDEIRGGGGDDLLDGGAGVDSIYGGDGADLIMAGTGVGDLLMGEAGDDHIIGSDEGSNVDPDFSDAVYFGDRIDGGSGKDVIEGLGGADSIAGGEGDDTIDSGVGADLIRAGAGDDFVFAGRGLGDQIFGDDGNDQIYGSHEGNDFVSGGLGNDQIYGQGGADTLNGDEGDDWIDGGGDADVINGGNGNDELFGGGGVGDQISGGAGDDLIHGSDDGADVIAGNAGRDRIYGNGGNDVMDGGADDDIIDGGAGDDVISGGAGSDLLLGGAQHDILYGHSQSGASDDNAVDYLYGDFGTNGNEAGSGRDQLFGNGGNDLLYGEGDDDAINGGTGGSNLINYGLGEAADPTLFVPPTPTPAPSILPTVGINRAGTTLQNRVNDLGRWVEYSSSATDLGLSNSTNLGLESALTSDSVGNVYVTWVDGRSGNYEIYVARLSVGGVWSELNNSAAEGGISKTLTSSRRPSIAIDASNNPMVSWTESTATGSEIRVARWDGATWTSSTGISTAVPGSADFSLIVQVGSGPVVAWLNTNAGLTNVYAKQLTGGLWSEFGGVGSASGNGISASTSSVGDLSVATNGTLVALAWTQTVGGSTEIYMKQSNGGAAWSGVAGSAAGGGLSATSGPSSKSSLAYLGNDLYAAWQDETSGFSEIYATKYAAGVRSPILAAGGGVSNTRGYAAMPQLASRGTTLELAWVDDTVQNRVGTRQAIYVVGWTGLQFAPALFLDRSFEGVSQTGGLIRELHLTLDPIGHPFIAWTDQWAGSPQVYLRGNPLSVTGVQVASDGFNVQTYLDTHDLGIGDVLLINGAVGGFVVGGDDAGLLVVGSPGGKVNGDVSVQVSNVSLQSLAISGKVTATTADRFSLRESTVGGTVTLSAGASPQANHNVLRGATGLILLGNTSAASALYNSIQSAQLGISVIGVGASATTLYGNDILAANGISIALGSEGVVERNDIQFTQVGLDITGAFGGVIRDNDIHGGTLGLKYRGSATLSANRIYGNTTGVEVSLGGNQGLGFVGAAKPNEIYSNTVGVSLTGLMRAQHVHHNTTGVTGSGVLGGADIETANLIEANGTGVNFAGIIQFNRIASNDVGIAATNGQIILHNLIYRNVSQGILVSGRADVRIVNNTVYAPLGDAIRITDGSSNVEVRNNILWAEQGYDLYVSNNSQSAVASDYNDLYATGAGRVAYWTKDFTDILDLQADVALIDLHSVGRTVVNPLWAEPRFFNRARDDYRVFDLVAGQRFSSPTVDAADPTADLGLSINYINLLSNPGFELGVQGWSVNVGAATRASDPAAFAGSSYFTAGPIAAGFAEQTINLLSAGFTPIDLDSQDFALVFGGRIRSAVEAKNDRGRIRLFFYDGNGVEISVPVLVEASNVSDRWELVGGRKVLPFGTRSVKIRFEADRESGATDDSFLDGAFVYLQSDTWIPNQGALGNTVAELSETPRAHIELRYPDLYTDWEREKPRLIRWESYNNVGETNVRIDLYQDDPVHGPALYKTITASTPDDGEFLWQPVDSQLGYGVYGLRVVVSFVGDNSVIDRSSETFTVPENGDVYWVDDASNLNDEYTPTAIGSNRNTGKLATAPKPNPINVLRVYDLGSGAVLNVDTGAYPLIYTATLSSKPGVGLGTDRGFLFRGPSNASRIAEFTTAIPDNTNQNLIYLDDADLMQIRFLTLTGGKSGIVATGGSNDLTVERVRIHDGASHGLQIDSNSDFDLLKDVTTYNHPNNMHGVAIFGGAGGVVENLVSFNNQIGLYATDVVLLTINGADLYYNVTGLRQDGGTTGVWSQVRSHANSGGIESQGAIVLNDSQAYENLNHGIATSGGTLTINRTQVYGNTTGIYLRDGSINDSRIYANLGIGIHSEYSVLTLSGNSVYSNDIGLMATAFTGGSYLIQNNLFYGQRTAAIRITGTQPAGYEIVNNTLYEPLADGIYASGTDSVHLRNNIIWTQSGYGIRIANDSQNGFTSNFNLLYVTGTGKVGFWQGDRTTLTDWQFSNFRDGDSLSMDPLFVDADGVDGLLGAQILQGLNASYFAGKTLSGAPVISRLERTINLSLPFGAPDALLANDNWSARFQGFVKIETAGQYVFHLNSGGPQRLYLGGVLVIDDFGSPSNGEQTYTYAAAGPGLVELVYEMADDGGPANARLEWVTPASGGEKQVIAVGNLSPSLVRADGSDDNFHESSRYGSYKPGLGFTLDLVQSPAIDRGRPGDAFGIEPEENGGYVNLGAYGNLATASKSPAQYILITNPNGGERLPQKTVFDIRWRSDGFAGTVRIQYSVNGPAGPYVDLSANEANDGSFTWTLTQGTFPASDQYVVRISSIATPSIADTSDTVFSVIPPIANYYVNDGATDGDEYTTAPGNDANDGLTRATPKLSIRAILETYDLEFGDTIFVDTGVYALTSNIIVTHADSGTRIQGPVSEGHQALLNRGNASAGSYVFELNDADAITLSNLSITGAYEGVYLSAVGDGSSLFTLQNSRVFENANAGLNITSATSSGAIIRDNVFYGDVTSDTRDQNYGVYTRGLNPTVLRNQAYHVNGSRDFGIYLDNVGDTVVVRDNLVWNNSNTGLTVIAGSYLISGNVARENNRGFYFEDTTPALQGRSENNLAYGNATGFDIRGSGLSTREEALDNTTGFNVQDFSGVVDQLVAWRNTTGISIINGTLQNSRVFGNLTTGVFAGRGDITIQGNVIYDNGTGLWSQNYYGTNLFAGNLFYDNRDRAIFLDSVNSSNGTIFLTGNTFSQVDADAIQISGTSKNVQLLNNIIQVSGLDRYALRVGNSAQSGFVSDYNLFHLLAGAKLALWQNPIPALADWRYEIGFDVHSISADPRFVNPAGSDGIRGFQDQSGLQFEYFNNVGFTGSPVITAFDRSVNFPSTFGSFRAFAGQPGDSQSFRWTGEVYLPSAGSYRFFINSQGPQRLSLGGTVLIDGITTPATGEQSAVYSAGGPGWVSIRYEVVDPVNGAQTMALLEWSTPDNPQRRVIRASEQVYVAGVGTSSSQATLRYGGDLAANGLDDDFHLSSTAGSWHGGTFAPDLVDSPGIDSGSLTSAYDRESADNGGRVNLGFEGNTPAASRTKSPGLQLLSPNGFEKFTINGGVLIQWRTIGVVDFVDIDISLDGGTTFVAIATAVSNDGNFAWNPTQASVKAMIRIRNTLNPNTQDISDNVFSIGAVGNFYYVNDGSTTGDQYSLAVGSNLNSGKSRNDPMLSLGALLAAYDLGAGDVIFVDTGYYSLATNVRIGVEDAGVTIQGPTNTLSSASDYLNLVLASQPIAYYRLGDTTGTVATDASGNGLNGIFRNTPTLGKPGALVGDSNKSVGFDGTNEYVELPSGFANFSKGITLEMWVNPSGAGGDWQRIYDLGNGQQSDNIVLARRGSGADLSLFLYNGSTYVGEVAAFGVLEYNKWQHIAATIDVDGTATIYRNGNVVATGTLAAPKTIVRTKNYIARSNWTSDGYFAGGYDEGAIYDRALTPEVISQHYFTIASQGALFHRGNVADGSNVFQLDGADDVTFANLAITGGYNGIQVGGGSHNFTLKNSKVFENANVGLTIIDAASSGAVIQDNVFYGDAPDNNRDQNYGVFTRGLNLTILRNQAFHVNGADDYGIYVENGGNQILIANNLFYGNSNTGLLVTGGQFDIHDNVARNNGRGFYFEDTTPTLTGVAHGNVAFNNTTGFDIRGYGDHYDESAYENTTGFNIQDYSSTVHAVRSWLNTTGVSIINGILKDSQIFANKGAGILMGRGDLGILGNRIYDNATGIYSQAFYGTNLISNNLIYGNSLRGVLLENVQTSGGVTQLFSNTIAELSSNAVEVTESSQNVSLKNNILWTGGLGHFAISVANTAQRGFASDYNLIYFTESASMGLWQNTFNSLSDWRYELGFDLHSISTDPLFVDRDGADNILGYQDFMGLRFEYFANANFTGTPAVTLIDRYLDFASTSGSFRALPGQPGDSQSFRWTGEIYVSQAGTYNFWINSQGPQRLTVGGQVVIDDFANPSNTEQTGSYQAAGPGWVSLSYEVVDPVSGGPTMARLEWATPDNITRRVVRALEPGVPSNQGQLRYQSTDTSWGDDDNFHLQSRYGSFKSGSGTFTADSLSSPAIDAGELSAVFGNEPIANGGRINLGYDGNTPLASKSGSSYVQLLSFNGGEKVRIGQASLIRWRSAGVGPLDIYFSPDNGANWSLIGDNEVNDGVFAWNPSQFTVAGRIRLVDAAVPVNDPNATADVSEDVFTVGVAGTTYYVNDGSTAGSEFGIIAVGSNGNSGTTPTDPMASLNALLSVYDLNPGDRIYVDTGLYTLPTNIRLLAQDSGVEIIGPSGTGHTATFDRGNVNDGQWTLEMRAAKNVSLRHLTLTGGQSGLVAYDADGLKVYDSSFINNALNGVFLETDNSDVLLSGNVAYGTTGNAARDQDNGFYLRGDRMTITNNTAYKVGIQFGTGFYVDSAEELVVSGNLAYNNVNGFTLSTSQADIHHNTARGNDRGIWVGDTNGAFRTTVHDNDSFDNDLNGFEFDDNVESYLNRSHENDGAGYRIGNNSSNTVVHDNSSYLNGIGIQASLGLIDHNRIFGNLGAGVVLDYSNVILNGNSIYGNARGVDVTGPFGAITITSNLIYDNANQAIYVHGAVGSTQGGVRIVNNTLHHEAGSAIKLENNGNNIKLYNNILWINGGLGIEMIGNTTGYDSNYNDIYAAKPGAFIGKWLALPQSVDLAAWRIASGKDAASLSADPQFVDINGPDNLFGWEKPDPQSPFADFGQDDNFHVRRGSPAIDAGDSEVAPVLDADGLSRQDDLGSINNGNGVFRFYDLGAFEFRGSSNDVTPPLVTGFLPSGMADNALIQSKFGTLVVRFSEALDPVSARSIALYSLVEAGKDGVFGTGDDVQVALKSVSYTVGDTEVRLELANTVAQGIYRFTLGTDTESVLDQAGNALDGDANGAAGGKFIRTFTVNLAPEIQSFVINDGAIQRSRISSVTLQFSENVQPSLGAGDFRFTNLTTGVDVAPSSLILAYDSANNRVTISFKLLPESRLQDGNYRLTILANAVSDATGKGLGADFSSTFHSLRGDANGDRITNDLDLYRVWQNLLKPSAARSLNEDLNGDGLVDSADLKQVSLNYMVSLPAAPIPPSPADGLGLGSLVMLSDTTSPAPVSTQAAAKDSAHPAVAGAESRRGLAAINFWTQSTDVDLGMDSERPWDSVFERTSGRSQRGALGRLGIPGRGVR